jgi:flavin-dependent dehydrogenase
VELRQAIVRPEVFDRICALLPGVAPWTDPDRAEPAGKVFSMGDLSSRWRGFVAGDQRAVLGLFAVGDSLIRTNPLYGRGCSFAAVEAQTLAEVLAETKDPSARARLYDFRLRETLSFHYQTMRDQDRGAIARADRVRAGRAETSLKARVTRSFFEDGVRIAVRSDMDLLRAALRDFHMIDAPGAWLKRPENVAKVFKWWARGKRRNADAYPPPLGPDREAMLASLGVLAG